MEKQKVSNFEKVMIHLFNGEVADAKKSAKSVAEDVVSKKLTDIIRDQLIKSRGRRH